MVIENSNGGIGNDSGWPLLASGGNLSFDAGEVKHTIAEAGDEEH